MKTPNLRPKVLVVDDEKPIAAICAHFIQGAGWEVLTAASGEEALDRIAGDATIGVVFLDMKLPGRDGIDVLREVKRSRPAVEVVMITAHGTIDLAVEAMKVGAADFVTKPFTRARVLAALERVERIRGLQEEVVRLRDALDERQEFEGLVGQTEAMRKVFSVMSRTAQTDSTVLIVGESGTGKDMVARSIHTHGARRAGPFIPVNCAALPAELIESELFGYKKGAFTGAVSDSIGLFRAAQGGTLYLDEIVEMPVGVQAKLLRVLEARKIRPVGGTEEVEVDARVIAATNQDVDAALAAGRLREDLYFRLSVITLALSPLRQRRGDVPFLVEHFLRQFNAGGKRVVQGIAPEALYALEHYPWPGNVRELKHVIERAVTVGEGSIIRPADLPPEIRKYATRVTPGAGGVPVERLDDAEKALLTRALDAAGGNRSRAAHLLGVSRKKLYHMIEKYKIPTDKPK
jgi:two-component system NtrC family response regulator